MEPGSPSRKLGNFSDLKAFQNIRDNVYDDLFYSTLKISEKEVLNNIKESLSRGKHERMMQFNSEFCYITKFNH